MTETPRLYYVRGGASHTPALDIKKTPNPKTWERRLVDVKRSGIAWAYRGIYVGVVRTGTYQLFDRQDRVRERQRWLWTLWIRRTCEPMRAVWDPEESLLVKDLYTLSSKTDATVQLFLDRYLKDFPNLQSVDDVPLTIHAIEDPVARQSATQAYLEAVV